MAEFVELANGFRNFPSGITGRFCANSSSDGRDALALDHVSSSAITSPEPPMAKRASDGAVEGRFLMGPTNQPIAKALPIARAWIHPA